MSMESLYQEIILDHQKHPQNFGLADASSAKSHQLNPICGDEITLQLHVGAGEVVTSVTWEGKGCAISQASASLFSELAAGLTMVEVDERIDAFRTAMRSRGAIVPDEELLGDAAALGGVSKYVARVKCAMLAWVAAEDALTQVRAL